MRTGSQNANRWMEYLSIEGGYSTTTREGPKLFNEYESNALFALIAQLGVGIIGLSNVMLVVIMISFLQVFMTFYWVINMVFALVYFATAALLFPVSIFQSYYGWRLHQQTITIETCVKLDVFSLVMSVASFVCLGLTAPIAIILGGQVLIAIAVVDVIAIALLRSDSAKREFRSSSQPLDTRYRSL